MSKQTVWVSDPSHSEITFKVKHLMITNVKGEFRNFQASVITDGEDITQGNAKVIIEAASVFTNNNDRDNHLRSADFFDVENHKELIFESKSFKLVEEGIYKLAGVLSIRGISNDIELLVEYGGINKDPWGNDKAGFSVSGSISRKAWGLMWNVALESGGVLVSDDVKIYAEVQFVKQA